MYVQANGSRFFVHTAGAHDAPAVLLIHSLTADHTAWAPQIPLLAERFHVIAVDIRGHGQSSATPPPYSMDLLADDMAGILEKLEITKAHVVGLSIGGMIAQALALNHPDHVHSLVLAATASEMNADRAQVWQDRISAVQRDGVEALVDATLQRWFTPPTHAEAPDLIARCAAMIRNTSPEGYAGCGAAIRDLNLTSRLNEIAVPTLVLSAENDASTPPELQSLIKEAIPGARMESFKATAHQISMERPERFNALMMAFLDSHTG
jgi:3-oxoadipate enol-lactonase